MSKTEQEIEAKFYIRDLKKITTRLHELEARLIQSRVLETNLRFDLLDGGLRSEGRVLRLRQDSEARLTYKSANNNDQGVLSRAEIEFTVGDFEKAKQFLHALGYQPIFYYEKYRTTYALESDSSCARKGMLSKIHEQARGLPSCHIMLDELPYGNFIEIEGDSVETIGTISDSLGLKWDTAIAKSYHALFDHLKAETNLLFRDLLFENFTGIQVDPNQLGVQAADHEAG